MMNKPTEQESPQLFLNEIGLKALKQTAGWARVLALAGLFLIGGMAWIGIKNLTEKSDNTILMMACLLFAILLCLPVIWLFQYAYRLRKGICNNESDKLNQAFLSLASCFKWFSLFAGLAVIIYIIFISVAGMASLLGWGAH